MSFSCTPAVALVLPLSHGAVDHIEAILPLIQPQLEVGRLARIGEINGAPLDVEDAVRCSAGYRGIEPQMPPG